MTPANLRRGPIPAIWSLAARCDDPPAPYQRRPTPGPGGYAPCVHIVLDTERCTGHGRCYSLAPHLFDADDEGHSVLLRPDVPPEHRAEAKLAIDACPESCISMEG